MPGNPAVLWWKRLPGLSLSWRLRPQLLHLQAHPAGTTNFPAKHSYTNNQGHQIQFDKAVLVSFWTWHSNLPIVMQRCTSLSRSATRIHEVPSGGLCKGRVETPNQSKVGKSSKDAMHNAISGDVTGGLGECERGVSQEPRGWHFCEHNVNCIRAVSCTEEVLGPAVTHSHSLDLGVCSDQIHQLILRCGAPNLHCCITSVIACAQNANIRHLLKLLPQFTHWHLTYVCRPVLY